MPRTIRLLTLSLLAAVGVFTATACGDEGGVETTGSGIEVVATTTQVGALTRAVAGDNVALTVLLAAGADAHDYEPNPKAVKKIGEAQVILRNGLGLDDWLDDTIEGAGGDAAVITVTDGIALRETEGAPDPHVWHNPQNAKLMLDNIVAALSAADPAQASLFAQNGTAYKQVLDKADAEIRALIDAIPVENRKVVTNHDALGYFFDRYGLEFIGAIIPTTSKDAQASAKELAALQDLIETEGVKAILAEEEVDPKVARELAADTGVKIVEGLYADSLGEAGSGADTIDGMLLSNARKIAEGLQ